MNMNDCFKVGDRVYGFCNGFFGRDCYENKICVFVTDRYAVFEDLDDGFGRVLNFIDERTCLQKWGDKDYFLKSCQEWKIKEANEQ